MMQDAGELSSQQLRSSPMIDKTIHCLAPFVRVPYHGGGIRRSHLIRPCTRAATFTFAI
jgi:hypothetical protein